MSKKKNSFLEPFTKTTDGKDVFKGVYRFYETEGLPLDIIFDSIFQRNGMISWIHFYEEACANGMKHDRIISKLEEPVCDVWGKGFFDVVHERLNEYSVFRNSWKGTTEDLLDYLFIESEIKSEQIIPDKIIMINEALEPSMTKSFTIEEFKKEAKTIMEFARKHGPVEIVNGNSSTKLTICIPTDKRPEPIFE